MVPEPESFEKSARNINNFILNCNKFFALIGESFLHIGNLYKKIHFHIRITGMVFKKLNKDINKLQVFKHALNCHAEKYDII